MYHAFLTQNFPQTSFQFIPCTANGDFWEGDCDILVVDCARLGRVTNPTLNCAEEFADKEMKELVL